MFQCGIKFKIKNSLKKIEVKMSILIQWQTKPHQVTVIEERKHLKDINEGEMVEISYIF